jgi:hypothetical protein
MDTWEGFPPSDSDQLIKQLSSRIVAAARTLIPCGEHTLRKEYCAQACASVSLLGDKGLLGQEDQGLPKIW